MTSAGLKRELGGSGGSSAPMAWVRSSPDSASNSRKRREIFQAAFDSELASAYLRREESEVVTGHDGEESAWVRRQGIGTCRRKQRRLQ